MTILEKLRSKHKAQEKDAAGAYCELVEALASGTLAENAKNVAETEAILQRAGKTVEDVEGDVSVVRERLALEQVIAGEGPAAEALKDARQRRRTADADHAAALVAYAEACQKSDVDIHACQAECSRIARARQRLSVLDPDNPAVMKAKMAAAARTAMDRIPHVEQTVQRLKREIRDDEEALEAIHTDDDIIDARRSGLRDGLAIRREKLAVAESELTELQATAAALVS